MPAIDETLLQFAISYALVLISPGPIMLTAGSVASAMGLARAVPFVAGASLMTGATMLLVGLSVGHALVILPERLLQQLGCLALLCIAAMLLLPRRAMKEHGKLARMSLLALLIGGMLAALSSPLNSVFATSLFAELGPLMTTQAVLILAILVCAANFVWYLTVAAAFSSSPARAVMARHERSLRTLSAVALGLLALANLDPWSWAAGAPVFAPSP